MDVHKSNFFKFADSLKGKHAPLKIAQKDMPLHTLAKLANPSRI